MIARLLSAGTHLAAGTIIQVVLAFVGNVILLRELGPDEFGRFAVTLAGASLIASVLSLRLGVVIVRTPDAEFTTVLQNRYFTAILLETAIVAAASSLWLIVSGRDLWIDTLIVAAVAIQSFCSHARAFWERTMAYRKIATAETAVVAIAQVVGVAVVLTTGSDAALYFREFAMAVSMLAMLRLVGGLSLRPLTWPGLHGWRDLLREARGIWLDSIFEGIFQRFTVIAAAFLAGDRGAGLFSMAQRLAVLPHQIAQPFGRVAASWFSRTTAGGRRAGRDRLIGILVLPLSAAALLAVAVADPVVPWLFGSHWREAIPILIGMSGVMVFMSIFEVARGYALVTKQTASLLLARLAQFAAFALGVGAAWMVAGEASLIYLGAGLSIAFAAAFAVQLGMIRRRERL